MGGLGNGRRGGRSPPLMIGALIACILVLGFNYWVSSSRNLELQTKLYELEGQVRRGAAERGAAEMKNNEFQEEIQRQKDQMSHMESLFKRQVEGAQNTCSQEKGTLLQNISSSTKTIQELKGQLNQLNDDLGKLQEELQSCQGNIKTLNSKHNYEITRCHSQVASQKELCDEKVAAIQKEMEKLISPPEVTSQENAATAAVTDDGAVKTANDTVKTPAVVSHTPSVSQPGEKDTPELLTNEIVDRVSNTPESPLPEKAASQSVPSAAAVRQDILPPPEGDVATQDGEAENGKPLKNNLSEDKDMEVMDVRDDAVETEDRMDGLLMHHDKADETPVDEKPDDLDEYDAEEQAVGEEKQQQSKQPENIDLDQELADYNGDDENEGEFEADKQAALAQN